MISVCMATYQGERFVQRQITSILAQLGEADELIVVDDASRDRTAEVVRNIGDARVQLHVNLVNRREVYSFGRAIALARGDFIFLSDQDDVWLPGRVEMMCARLRRNNVMLATSNFVWMDENENPIDVPFDGVQAASSRAYARNIWDIFVGKTTYFGCAMVFRRELVDLIDPIPAYVECHDWWIPVAANLAHSNLHIDDATFRKRLHGANATSTISKRKLLAKVRSRVILLRSLLDIQRRLAGWRDRNSSKRLSSRSSD